MSYGISPDCLGFRPDVRIGPAKCARNRGHTSRLRLGQRRILLFKRVCCTGSLATAIAISTLAPIPVAGQTARATADTSTPRYTPWGRSGLQGVWVSDSATPLERPDELAGRAVLTDEETAALAARAAQLFNGDTDAAFGESVFRPWYVVILMEMMHEARIIPLDGHPHVASNIRQRLGDSRGRREGNTLIVDTVNFADGAVRGRGGSRENLRLVERFARVDADTLQYEYTMHDQTTWTRSWTARIFMRPTPGTGAI